MLRQRRPLARPVRAVPVHLAVLQCAELPPHLLALLYVERGSCHLSGRGRARSPGRGVLPRRPSASRPWGYGGRTPPLHATHAGPALWYGALAVGGGSGGGAAGAAVVARARPGPRSRAEGGGLRRGQGRQAGGRVHRPAARPSAQHSPARRGGVSPRRQRAAAHPGPGAGERDLPEVRQAASQQDGV